MAPYGYRNSKASGTIEVEPREAEIVLYLYKTFATGNFSLKTLRAKFGEDGLVYKQRNRIPAKGHIDRILRNPIYIGMMRIKDVVYPGKHEPIVSMELYDKVRVVFKAANKPKYTKKGFIFSGMMGVQNADARSPLKSRSKSTFIITAPADAADVTFSTSVRRCFSTSMTRQ